MRRILLTVLLLLATQAWAGSWGDPGSTRSAPESLAATDLAATDLAVTDLTAAARRQTEAIRAGGRDWPVLETRYFLIHHEPGHRPDPASCQALDGFTREVWSALAGPAAPAVLQGRPVDYYLCDDATVQRLTGYPTKGMADLAGRAVISSHFPHFHELVHLLVHELAAEPPTLTLPVMQEGLACLLGGRWGRGVNAVLYTGWVHRNMSGMDLNRALSHDGFLAYPGGPDASYPLAALICQQVWLKASWPGLLEMNRRLSGALEKVLALEAGDFYAALEEVCELEPGSGEDWLRGRLEQAWPAHRRCGLAPAGELTGKREGELGEDLAEEVVFTVTADTFPVYRTSPPSPGQHGLPSLFAEHFPGRAYEGQRFGLRASPDEVALYNYPANQLMAIWVAGFTDEWGACGEDGEVRFAASGDLAQCLAGILEPAGP